MSKKQQKALFENTARAMGGAPKKIKLRHIGNCLWPRGGWCPRYPAQRSTQIVIIIQGYRWPPCLTGNQKVIKKKDI